MVAKTYNQMTKAREQPHKLAVMKSDDDKRLVFGWANVAIRVDGEQIVDWQQDAIDTEDLEKAAYEYVAEFGTAGEMHQRGGVGRGRKLRVVNTPCSLSRARQSGNQWKEMITDGNQAEKPICK